MIEASITSFERSSVPASRSSSTSTSNSCGQTPRSIHSCSLRRQVSPLGKPSSRGTST
jgi:hypothetical protein